MQTQLQTQIFTKMQFLLALSVLPSLHLSRMWPEFITPPDFGLIVPETAKPVPLQKIHVDSHIKGNIAHSTITFTYKNDYNRTLTQTNFRFPVASDTAVYSLDAMVNGVSFSGIVKERKQAEKEFQEAVDAGKSAVLVKENEKTSDILEMSVGNVQEDEIAVITVKQVHELSVFKVKNKVLLSYLFPTSLFVRYTPKNEENRKTDYRTTTGESFSSNISYTMDFSLKVWASNDHGSSLKVVLVNENLLKGLKAENVELENTIFNDEKSKLLSKFSFKNSKSVFGKDRDISVNLVPKMSKFGQLDAAMFNDVEIGLDGEAELSPFDETENSISEPSIFEPVMTNKTTDFLQQNIVKSTFLISPEWLKADKPKQPSEYIIIADCSGSMTGERIENAKNMLTLLINSLPTDSYFNVVKFGTDFYPLFKENSKKYGRDSLKKAVEFANDMQADCGGTELVPAMDFVKNFTKKSDSRNIFVITDGSISNTEEAVSLASEFKKFGDRVFSFGIGAGASTELVNGLAESGNGYASFVHEYSNKDLKTYFNDENLNEIIVKAIVAASENYMSVAEFCVKFEDFSDENCIPIANTSLPNVIVDREIFSHFSLFDDDFESGEISLKFNDNGETKLMSKWSSKNPGMILDRLDLVTAEMRSPFFDGFSLPLHRLWAKREMQKLVKDYAKEGDWRKDTGGLKSKIVELSVSSNVLSPFTGLIAVDKSGEQVGDSDLEPLIVENPLYMNDMVMNRGLARGGGMVRQMSMAMPPPMSMAMPVGKLIMANGPSMPVSASGSWRDAASLSESMSASTTTPILSVKKTTNEDIYKSILTAQDFSGWFATSIVDSLDKLEGNTDLKDFYKNVETSEFKIIKSKKVTKLSQILPEKYFSTVVAVVELLGPKYGSKANELVLILKKAAQFLETRNQSNASKVWKAKWRKFAMAVAGKVAKIRGFSASKTRMSLKRLFN